MAEWESFRQQIVESAGGDPVQVTGTGDTIVLTGIVKSAEMAKRLAGMAQARARTVVNLLQAPPPPPPRQILLQVKFADIDRVALTQMGFNLFSLNPNMMGGTSTAAIFAAALRPAVDQRARRPRPAPPAFPTC